MILKILALLPILALGLSLLVFRRSLMTSSILGALLALIIGIFTWQIPLPYIGVGIIRGIILAIDISLIIFGALLFLHVMRVTKTLDKIEDSISSLSKDYRVQVVLLAWFFSGFLEGTAGFGIPAMIVAPLLIHLGLKPLPSITAALVANSTATVFGAVGTPIAIGLVDYPDIAREIVVNTAMFAGLIGMLLPTVITYIAIRSSKIKEPHQFLKILPFTLFSGVAFTLPYYLTAVYLENEFVSIIASIVGLAVISIVIKLKLLIPSETISLKKPKTNSKQTFNIQSFIPYAIFISLLLLLKQFLPEITFTYNSELISFRLFNPGLIFLFSAFIWIFIKRPPLAEVLNTKGILPRVARVALIIFLLGLIIQTMRVSVYNNLQLDGMLEIAFAGLSTPYLPLISPWIGAFGSFLSGSVTVSNILFGPLQESLAISSGLPVAVILAIQSVGGTGGNMISLSNIVAIKSVVETKTTEAEFVLKLLPWMILYIILLSLLGYLFVNVV